MKKQLLEMRNMEIKLLIIEYNKASQIDRSFGKTSLTDKKKKIFREKLLENCIFLMEKIDNGTLTNEIIRKKKHETNRTKKSVYNRLGSTSTNYFSK